MPAIGLAVLADGMTDMIPDQGIHATLSALQSNLSLAARQLVPFANDGGRRDNISVILVRVSQCSSSARTARR